MNDVSVPNCFCSGISLGVLPDCAMHKMEKMKEKKIKIVLIQDIGSALLSIPV